MTNVLNASELLELMTSHWRSAVVTTSVQLGLFDALEAAPGAAVEQLCSTTGLHRRPIQALLDGLAALGLVSVADATAYTNSLVSSRHLVSNGPEFMGGFAHIVLGAGDGGMRQWSHLAEAIRADRPVEAETLIEPDHPFWDQLVKALVPLSREAASLAIEILDLNARNALSILDVGGGAGGYAQVLLERNRTASVTQIDWAPVNKLARANIDSLGIGERFVTLDGDFHRESFGDAIHDLVVFSNIFHHETPEASLVLLQKARSALRTGGIVLISDFVLRDDRSGPAFAALFSAGMVLQTPNGASYRESDYVTWLETAGLCSPRVSRAHPLSTLIWATLD